MADIDRFSERLVDLAERFADVTDAAQGRGNRQGGIRPRWFLLPAAAAGVYLLGASGSLRRQAGNVAKQAKDRGVAGRPHESGPSGNSQADHQRGAFEWAFEDEIDREDTEPASSQRADKLGSLKRRGAALRARLRGAQQRGSSPFNREHPAFFGLR
jgi:hypothetical protein